MVHYDVSHQHWKLGTERGGRNFWGWMGLVIFSIFHSLKVIIRLRFLLSQFIDWSLEHEDNKSKEEWDACIWIYVIVLNFHSQIGNVYPIVGIDIKPLLFVENGDAVCWSCCISILLYPVGSQFFIRVSVCGSWIKFTSTYNVAISWINLEESELLVDESFLIYLSAYLYCRSNGFR